MPTGRRSARRVAVFILYQQDLLRITAKAALKRSSGPLIDDYARRLVQGIEEHRDEIDRQISANITGWDLNRLGILERAILRVATYELTWETEVPHAVVIDEAVGLAKRFCSVEAGALVNGVLGAVAGTQSETGASSVGSGDTP